MDAPKKQLFVTEHNVTEIVNRIYVKKKDIKDPRIIESIKHLVEIAKDRPDCPVVTHTLFEARKEILEHASNLYANMGEDKLFDECTDELSIIVEILKGNLT